MAGVDIVEFLIARYDDEEAVALRWDAEQILMALAAPFADHPDYAPAWRVAA